MKPIITYHKNGTICSKFWSIDGKYHNHDNPAFLTWHGNGQKFQEIWAINGKIHSTDHPAVQCWYENGQKYVEQWWINGDRYVNHTSWLNKLVELGYKTKSEALFLLLKWS